MVKIGKNFLIGISVIIFSTFLLLFIFDQLNSTYQRCQRGEILDVCAVLSDFTLSIIIALILVGGFLISVSGAAYILLSS